MKNLNITIPMSCVLISVCCLASSCGSVPRNVSTTASKKPSFPAKTEYTTGKTTSSKPDKMLSHVLIYKTRANYDDKVPVILSDNGTQIVQYPAPTDVFFNGKLASPTILKDGYLLDNRGITAHVAFLQLTYTQYSKLPTAPLIAEMEKMIVDREPLLEVWDCGMRSKEGEDEVLVLNQVISNGFKDCKRIK